MRLLKSELVCQAVPNGFICSVCKKKYEQDDWMEIQESLHWSNRGGYGSVFGDGTFVSVDICQSCLSQVLGVYLEYEDNYDEQD